MKKVLLALMLAVGIWTVPSAVQANQVTGTCDGAVWLGISGDPSNSTQFTAATSINSSSGCTDARVRCQYSNGSYSSWTYNTAKFSSRTCSNPGGGVTSTGARHRTFNAIDQYQYINTVRP